MIAWTEPAHQRAEGDPARELFDTFERHRAAMYGRARSLVGHDLAADVVQEVITRAWRNLDQFDPSRGSMRAYLMTMTRGVSIDLLRQTSARRAREERDHFQQPRLAVDDALRDLIRDEEGLRLSEALTALRPAERELIHTAFYGDESYREIACRLGIPEGTVKTRIRSALRSLRCSLTDLRADLPERARSAQASAVRADI